VAFRDVERRTGKRTSATSSRRSPARRDKRQKLAKGYLHKLEFKSAITVAVTGLAATVLGALI
jgi:hypothetical protein